MLIDARAWGNKRGIGQITEEVLRPLLVRLRWAKSTVLTYDSQCAMIAGAAGAQAILLPSGVVGKLIDRVSWLTGVPTVPGTFDVTIALAGRPVPARGRKCIGILYDAGPLLLPELHTALDRLYMAATLRQARRWVCVITLTRAAAAELLGLDGMLNITNVWYPGVMVAECHDSAWESRNCVVCTAGLSPKKNGQRVVDAIAVLARRDPIWRKRLVMLGPESFVAREQFWRLLCQARVLVAPSLHEGFGLSVIEGLMAGCNVVASDIPPHREIGGPALAYFDPNSTTDLAGALQRAWCTAPGSYDAPLDWSVERAVRELYEIVAAHASLQGGGDS